MSPAAYEVWPVPPWSYASVPLLVSPLDASVNTGLLAVKLDMIGCAVNVATPVTPKVVDAVIEVKAPVLGVVPPMAPGTGNDVTLPVPSKLVPPIVRAVAKAVAVDALPVSAPVNVVALTVVKAPVLALEAPIGVLFKVLSVIAKDCKADEAIKAVPAELTMATL